MSDTNQIIVLNVKESNNTDYINSQQTNSYKSYSSYFSTFWHAQRLQEMNTSIDSFTDSSSDDDQQQ